jgi:hypothetical protein
MEKTYREFTDLATEKQEIFNELLAIQKKLIEKEKEIYELQLEKKSVAQKLIAYLHQARYDGIRKDVIVAYLQEFVGGIPSFKQVFETVSHLLCDKDKTRLTNTYKTLSEEKGKVESLVVRGIK